mmetsp:Transcript_55861/g.149530  ORF Transcript_55861/g.149530 Transcript_55861/m.149530 type:complete len:243 (+) Transcript_55861:676-1404(+)
MTRREQVSQHDAEVLEGPHAPLQLQELLRSLLDVRDHGESLRGELHVLGHDGAALTASSTVGLQDLQSLVKVPTEIPRFGQTLFHDRQLVLRALETFGQRSVGQLHGQCTLRERAPCLLATPRARAGTTRAQRAGFEVADQSIGKGVARLPLLQEVHNSKLRSCESGITFGRRYQDRLLEGASVLLHDGHHVQKVSREVFANDLGSSEQAVRIVQQPPPSHIPFRQLPQRGHRPAWHRLGLH